MTRARCVTSLAAMGGLAAMLAALLDSPPPVADLAVFAAAIAAGELVELAPRGRNPLPLSFAIFAVLLRAATPLQFVIVVVVAELAAGAIRLRGSSFARQSLGFAQRLAAALASGAAFVGLHALTRNADPRPALLAALASAAMMPILVEDLLGVARGKKLPSLRARSADVAIVTSGLLMAVGYRGIAGDGRLGLWGPILFSIPLIAAWYSFELLASTRRSFAQTVRALAAAPELGGLVRPGHSERVAALAVAMGEVLEMSGQELECLETAALLHHLGAVCLDEPDPGQRLDPAAVCAAGAAMLRASAALASAGDIVASEPLLHRPSGNTASSAATLAGMVLKVASAYDELTGGIDDHASWAVEALYTGPGYVYDGQVLSALERVLERRGALSPAR